jgi:formylglycine-generating enzyme
MGDRGDTVTVQPFCLDVTEVTADAYAACVRAGGCTEDHPNQWTSDGVTFAASARCNYGVAGKGRHPMNCVDWNQASAYCRWAGERLPTEEEWEWAARGQSRGTTYPWGNEAPRSQACWNHGDGTCAVGSYPAGDAPGGIHDLAGNVFEMTATHFTATTHVGRGGAWAFYPAFVLAAAVRGGTIASIRTDALGFRCTR